MRLPLLIRIYQFHIIPRNQRAHHLIHFQERQILANIYPATSSEHKIAIVHQRKALLEFVFGLPFCIPEPPLRPEDFCILTSDGFVAGYHVRVHARDVSLLNKSASWERKTALRNISLQDHGNAWMEAHNFTDYRVEI